jgi:nucleotide-binding universal stress UspA family protein
VRAGDRPRGYSDREAVCASSASATTPPPSQRALTTARQLADASGATVEALWFISRKDFRRRAPLPADWPDAGAILLTATQDRLDQIPGVSGHAVAGGPREELARLAHRVDLLIVGSRGYGPAHSLFLGSVSSYLQRHAASALLILPRARTARVAASSRDEALSPVAI